MNSFSRFCAPYLLPPIPDPLPLVQPVSFLCLSTVLLFFLVPGALMTLLITLLRPIFRLITTVGLSLVLLLPTPAAAMAPPDAANDALRLGITSFQAEDYAAAVEHFTQAIQHGGSSAAYSNRCLSQIYLEDYAAAIADCTQALRLNPKETEAYLNRGLAYYRLGEAEAAIQDYSQLLLLKPHDFRAYYNRGLAKAMLHAYREAIVDYGEAVRQVSPLDHATLAEIYNDRGLAQLGLDHPQQALADFSQAIQFRPTEIHAYYNRGCTYHQQGNLVAALEDFNRVVELAPDYAQAYLNRGLIQQQRGDIAAALVDLEQAAACFCQQGAMQVYQQTLNLIEKLRSSRQAIG